LCILREAAGRGSAHSPLHSSVWTGGRLDPLVGTDGDGGGAVAAGTAAYASLGGADDL
jgi:hypothetical protein